MARRPPTPSAIPSLQGVTGDNVPANCLGWETDIHSDINDFGVFDTTDILIGKRFDLILGGRYDAYNVTSSDTGILPYETAGPVSAGKGFGPTRPASAINSASA